MQPGVERLVTVNLPLEPIDAGAVVLRSAWPLHVTLLPNATTGVLDDVVRLVLRFAEEHAPIVATITGDARFGPSGDVHVDLLDARGLRRMHDDLVRGLAAIAATTPVEPGHLGPGHRPHITRRPGSAVSSPVTLASILLAELEPDGRPGTAVVLVSAPLTGPR